MYIKLPCIDEREQLKCTTSPRPQPSNNDVGINNHLR